MTMESGAVTARRWGFTCVGNTGDCGSSTPFTESYLLSHEEEVEARRDAEAEIRRLRARLEELGEGRWERPPARFRPLRPAQVDIMYMANQGLTPLSVGRESHR